MRVRNFFLATVSALTTTLLASTSWAQENLGTLETIGKPVDGLMGWQPPVTEVARDIQSYDTFLPTRRSTWRRLTRQRSTRPRSTRPRSSRRRSTR